MPKTRVIQVNPAAPEPAVIQEAARIIKTGGVVVFPTETVYGLGADGLNPAAVARIFAAKGRPPDNPVILHVSHPDEITPLVEEVPPMAWKLVKAFWPGPLTLILKRSKVVPDVVTAGLDTVATRMPDHPVALALIRASGVPLAAPSANISGRPSPTFARHVEVDLSGRVELVLDGGPTGVGLESTVLDLSRGKPVILRPGGVTREELAEVVGGVDVDPAVERQPDPDEKAGPARSPGTKYIHYAPLAPVVVVQGDFRREGELERMVATIQALADFYCSSGDRVGIMASRETAPLYRAGVVRVVGSRSDLTTVAANLFQTLRAFDEEGVDRILAEGFETSGIGLAVMNRLYRAAGFRVLPAGEDWMQVVRKWGVERLRGEAKENRTKKKENRTKKEEENGWEKGTVWELEGMKRILFVCTGNTCRSPMAEAIFRALAPGGIEASSAGVAASPGSPAMPQAVEVMKEMGLDLSGHRARQVEPEMLQEADLILTMTGRHKDAALGISPSSRNRVFTLKEFVGGGVTEDTDIPDPFGGSLEVYRRCARELEELLSRLVDRLGAGEKEPARGGNQGNA